MLVLYSIAVCHQTFLVSTFFSNFELAGKISSINVIIFKNKLALLYTLGEMITLLCIVFADIFYVLYFVTELRCLQF